MASQRADDARRRIELEEQDRRREGAAAQVLIDGFVVAARDRGIATEPLIAQLLDGHTARTDRHGWYLNASHSLAIGENGEYFQLVVAGGFRERLRGVRLETSLPPLHVGRGGRDGETGYLKEFLAWRLAAG
ncbi:hypothetical protein [Acidipropionibacterium jensenii]|uniref:Uncharacterized protein n=1 Tax=Acidipropionibacterium jensenii TaxID=1749 RepID=A0A3Q9UMV4_9ACTN|nr:hypothetical protein [Acidipropionibacterium jensenii]AZZ38500.1 hypothetical protein C0Z10_00635 [Acidipropionibacterium jensenii]AZZ41028.1 hypothetical protein C0Z11_00595 [Acidipropionibacterium jensenii]MDN5978309.1 hypothetical protein [Acidipropionibacterium jensenii]MDN5995557.1 hypothetical protein [Acidipropionibacterium jensenii]MDN6425688.1 hypothetical protein [Acidipropionibacterium jensenii]